MTEPVEEFEDFDDACCESAEWIDCDCEDADFDPDDCFRCGGYGSYLSEHCCACGGSPYCNCCRKCGASCVAACKCPITVTLESGKAMNV
jgi:hypothetical protein